MQNFVKNFQGKSVRKFIFTFYPLPLEIFWDSGLLYIPPNHHCGRGDWIQETHIFLIYALDCGFYKLDCSIWRDQYLEDFLAPWKIFEKKCFVTQTWIFLLHIEGYVQWLLSNNSDRHYWWILRLSYLPWQCLFVRN